MIYCSGTESLHPLRSPDKDAAKICVATISRQKPSLVQQLAPRHVNHEGLRGGLINVLTIIDLLMKLKSSTAINSGLSHKRALTAVARTLYCPSDRHKVAS